MVEYREFRLSSIASEFNFDADPESAFVVLNKTVCPTYLAPLELCQIYSLIDLVKIYRS
jgi:inosine-uridine nucleoside N-ribohydrolase